MNEERGIIRQTHFAGLERKGLGWSEGLGCQGDLADRAPWGASAQNGEETNYTLSDAGSTVRGQAGRAVWSVALERLGWPVEGSALRWRRVESAVLGPLGIVALGSGAPPAVSAGPEGVFSIPPHNFARVPKPVFPQVPEKIGLNPEMTVLGEPVCRLCGEPLVDGVCPACQSLESGCRVSEGEKRGAEEGTGLIPAGGPPGWPAVRPGWFRFPVDAAHGLWGVCREADWPDAADGLIERRGPLGDRTFRGIPEIERGVVRVMRVERGPGGRA